MILLNRDIPCLRTHLGLHTAQSTFSQCRRHNGLRIVLLLTCQIDLLCRSEISVIDQIICDTEVCVADQKICDTEVSVIDHKICDTEVSVND